MKKDIITVTVVVVLLYLLGMAAGVTCPVLELTGISCPGCGMTRAWLSLLNGDPAMAFAYHPLFWIPALIVVLWIVRKHIEHRTMNRILISLLVLILAVWIIRFFVPGDPVAQFSPENGLFCRLWSISKI